MEQEQLITERKAELLAYIQSFYRRSWDWRSQKFHERWDRYDRNYHAIYDPELASKKEPWQQKMFIPMTGQHCEVITSQMFKTMLAPNPPVQTEAGPAGDELQARLIQEAVAYQWHKAQFKVSTYDAMKEAVRYGSGFEKMYWDKVIDTRRRRVPVGPSTDEYVQGLKPEQLSGQTALPPPPIRGFEFQQVQVLRKNHLAAKYVHIRDIFPEPNTTSWDRVIHRDKLSYGEIVRNITSGAFFDVRDQIENIEEGSKFEQDTQTIRHERGYFETNRQLSKFEKKHTIWEFWGEIPRKWIEFSIPEGDEAEELVPAKAMVVSAVALLSSEENQEFDGEHPILKADYIRTGETYGKGVCELLGDLQEQINEIANQRIDNINLILNKGMAVIENALVNAEEDLVSKPGWIVRIKRTEIDDVKKAFAPIDWQDVTPNAYRESQEIERMGQEATGANRVTIGSSDQVRDTNQTLGGMELLRQTFNERMAALGMIIEMMFLMKAAERTYGLIYQKLTPQDMLPILGDAPVTISEVQNPMTGQMMPVQVPRYLAFAFVPPEEVSRSYRFKPMGVFSMENKVVKTAQFMDWAKMFAPVLDMTEAAKYAAKLMGNDEAEKMVIGMPMLPGMPGVPPPPMDGPGMKGGPNGNQPSFLPPNPVRREPVIG